MIAAAFIRPPLQMFSVPASKHEGAMNELRCLCPLLNDIIQ